MNTHKKNAFTLIELLVATTIIAVLIAIGTVSYSSVSRKSRDTKRRSDIEQIRAALEMYRADNGSYINAAGDATTALASLTVAPNKYMPKIPTDPKGVEYGYMGTNCSGGLCYGYNVGAKVEAPITEESTCPLILDYTYCIKNP